jgi:hypothetical protein
MEDKPSAEIRKINQRKKRTDIIDGIRWVTANGGPAESALPFRMNQEGKPTQTAAFLKVLQDGGERPAVRLILLPGVQHRTEICNKQRCSCSLVCSPPNLIDKLIPRLPVRAA